MLIFCSSLLRIVAFLSCFLLTIKWRRADGCGMTSVKQNFDTREFVKIMAAKKLQGTQSKKQFFLAQIVKWFGQVSNKHKNEGLGLGLGKCKTSTAKRLVLLAPFKSM